MAQKLIYLSPGKSVIVKDADLKTGMRSITAGHAERHGRHLGAGPDFPKGGKGSNSEG